MILIWYWIVISLSFREIYSSKKLMWVWTPFFTSSFNLDSIFSWYRPDKPKMGFIGNCAILQSNHMPKRMEFPHIAIVAVSLRAWLTANTKRTNRLYIVTIIYLLLSMCANVLNFSDCVKNIQNPIRSVETFTKLYLVEFSVPMPPTRKMSVSTAFEMIKRNDIMDQREFYLPNLYRGQPLMEQSFQK